MTNSNIHNATGRINLIELFSPEAGLVLLPAAVVRQLFRQQDTITVTLHFEQEGGEEWLTLSDAARRHVRDMPQDEPGRALISAKSRIERACKSGHLRYRGEGRSRRIDPQSLDVWRLRQRERDAEKADEWASGREGPRT